MHHRTAMRVVCLTLAATGLAACTVSRSNESSPAQDEAPPAAEAPSGDGAGDPYYPEDGNPGYDVTAYHVQISYDPGKKTLQGDTLVTAKASAALPKFNLDLLGLDVSSVSVGGAEAKFTREGDHELVITPAKPVAKGDSFETRVKYDGTPDGAQQGSLGENGWQPSASGGAFVAGEPHSATYWFPANDTPKDKATFKLDARVPNGWSVISNGVESPATPGNDGWTTYHWNEPTRIATYLTTVGIDKWTFERSTLDSGTPVVSAYAPGAEDKMSVESRLPEILTFLESKFGPYPQSAAGGIYINENIGFSLETQGRPIYAAWAEEAVVVHENAHQWYGNSVSVSEWKDICLNECFASYAQWLWDEAKYGVNLDEQYRTEVASGHELFAEKLYDMGAGNEFGAVYEKGPLALHALRREIGDDAFNRVLKEWPAKHRDGNASWPDFEKFVSETAGKDLTAFFEAWFRTDTVPGDEFLYPGPLRR
ncbi:MAG: M1 family metallopeptidase [Actinophytocola sp.]|uniref:M1 family metallopeptidase n=1 Tax=Actinophytocola sp. TaxID=1872138 RepID=UPI003C747930